MYISVAKLFKSIMKLFFKIIGNIKHQSAVTQQNQHLKRIEKIKNLAI